MCETARTHSKPRRQGGFTLVEIMVVVVILGLLATLVAPAVLSRQADAQIGVAKSDIASIASAVELFMTKNNLRVPEMEELLEEDEHGQPWIKGGNFSDGGFLDPWGNNYEIIPLEGMNFDVRSWGPDGEEDTEDDINHKQDRDG